MGRYIAGGKLDSKGFQEFGKTGLTNTLGTLFLVTLGTNTVDIQKEKETQEPEQRPDNCSCMTKKTDSQRTKDMGTECIPKKTQREPGRVPSTLKDF